jgi:hypothetical protein
MLREAGPYALPGHRWHGGRAGRTTCCRGRLYRIHLPTSARENPPPQQARECHTCSARATTSAIAIATEAQPVRRTEAVESVGRKAASPKCLNSR